MKRNNAFRKDPPSIARGIGPRNDLTSTQVPSLHDFGVVLRSPDEAIYNRTQAERLHEDLDQPKTDRRQDQKD